MNTRVEVIGVCRFSLLCSGGFQTGPEDLEQRSAYLFDPVRLTERFAWFEQVTLPSLRSQTDADFRFVVLSSTAMPGPWRERLLSAVVPGGPVEVDFVEPGPHHHLCNGAITSRIRKPDGITAQFRIDDDDGVAVDYVARIRADFGDGLAPLVRRFGAAAADHSLGLVLEDRPEGLGIWRHRALGWPAAQTLYVPAQEGGRLFAFHHGRLHHKMPVVTFGDRLMFARGRHDHNDSSFVTPGRGREAGDPASLKRRFGIDADALHAALHAAREPAAGTTG